MVWQYVRRKDLAGKKCPVCEVRGAFKIQGGSVWCGHCGTIFPVEWLATFLRRLRNLERDGYREGGVPGRWVPPSAPDREIRWWTKE